MSAPVTHSPNRFRALRYANGHALIGVGSSRPQLVGPLGDDVLRTVLGAGPLTTSQWASAFRKLDAGAAEALANAVRRVVPHDLGPVSVHVDGDGPVAASARELLSTLGAELHSDRPALTVSIGAPGTMIASGTAQLVVELGSDQVVIGPLLRRDAGPCASCLDIRRTQLDPNWPLIQTQLRQLTLCDVEPATAPELAHLAVGLIGVVSRGHFAGRPLPPGIAVRATTGEYAITHHLWPVHPLCECQAPRQDTSAALVG